MYRKNAQKKCYTRTILDINLNYLMMGACHKNLFSYGKNELALNG